MKKLMLMLFAVAAFATVKAEDSYLYWMISGTEVPAFSYATLYVDQGGGNVVALTGPLTGVGDGETQTSLSARYTAISPASSGYSYYVELLNADMETTYQSELFGYTQFAGSVYTPPASPAQTAYAVSSFSAVPEPTSGLMMLLGVALLGLKRKRV